MVYNDDCVQMSTVYRWAKKICKDGEPGKTDLCDQERSGWLVTATNELHMKKLGKLIKGNRQITQKKIAVKLGISQECALLMVFNIKRLVQDGFLTCQ